jgi:hypothetical protein
MKNSLKSHPLVSIWLFGSSTFREIINRLLESAGRMNTKGVKL